MALPAIAATYVDNGDGTVTDPATGLTWMRCVMGQVWTGSTCGGGANGYTWDQAKALAGSVGFAGKSDWYLPAIAELRTSFYLSAAFPNLTYDNQILPWLWSSTWDPIGVLAIDVASGRQIGAVSDARLLVRLVRVGESALTVTSTGVGSGTVTSSPAGIQCGGTCSASFGSTTSVTLTASPANGSIFSGWSGGCSNTTGTCTVATTTAKTVTAIFGLATAPNAPASVVGMSSGESGQASISFSNSTFTGGSPIVYYTVTASPGGQSATGNASPITVTGLTNGTSYTFTVTATNSVGTSVASSPSNAVTPVGLPSAPTNVSATAGTGQATITFTPSSDTGGAPVTYYTVTASPGGRSTFGNGSPLTVTGLTNGTSYTFTVTATSSVGTGSASLPSSAVTPGVPATAPSAPTSVTAGAGDTKATVSFVTPASTGGSAITGYTVTASPGGQTGSGTSSPITITGLTNGVSYTFTVTAANAIGTSSSSVASNTVVPVPTLTGITLNPSSIAAGASGSIVAVPGGATLPECNSSNTSVATVSGAQIQAVSPGSTFINCGSAAAPLTVTAAATVTDLTLGCPSAVTSGQTGLCTATATYSTGTTKTVQVQWTSDNAALKIDASGNITTSYLSTSILVTLNATYSEGKSTLTRQSTVQLMASPLGACTGTKPYTMLLTINGQLATTPLPVKANDPVNVELCMANFDGHTQLDVYVAVALPGQNGAPPSWYVASPSALFNQVQWSPWDLTSEPVKFMAKQTVQSLNTQQIVKFNIPAIWVPGLTTLYVQAVFAGKRLMDTSTWSALWQTGSASFSYQP